MNLHAAKAPVRQSSPERAGSWGSCVLIRAPVLDCVGSGQYLQIAHSVLQSKNTYVEKFWGKNLH